MRRKPLTGLKRAVAAGLSVSLLLQGVQSYSNSIIYTKGAESPYNYLPAATMPEEIQDADTFYVGTTSAELDEAAGKPYLLQIGRGGKASGAASVVLKISDATAGYGKDYKICLHSDKKTEADSPEDNQSLLDVISENDVLEELQLSPEEQAAAEQENLESLTQAAKENAETDTSEERGASGETEKADSDEKVSVKEGNNINNPLAQAKETLTGVTSDRETVTSTKQSMIDVLSDSGNYLTQMVPGATLTVDFEVGEKSKYVEIIPIDNDESDGDRTFYVTLSEPSEGMTNSSVSESMFTIKDNEPREDATVSFADAEFVADADSSFVEVVLKRSGAMTQMVSVHMTSKAGSAVSGQDFAPVDADVLFPFGIKERKLKITVDSQHLEKDADFTLQISNGSGAVTGENSQAKVTIKAEKAKDSKNSKKKVKVAAGGRKVSIQADLKDKKYGPALNLEKAWSKEWNSGDISVSYANSELSIRCGKNSWVNVFVALSGNRMAATREYIYDGVRFKWKKTSNKTCYSSANVQCLKEGQYRDGKILYNTEDKPRFDWQTMEYYFGNIDVWAANFYNKSWKSGALWNPSTLYVKEIEPILRPFKVELAPAAALKYYDEKGDLKENGNAVASTLENSVGGYVMKYSGDNMIINANSVGISRLSGVQIVSDNNSKAVDSRFLNGFKIGDSKIMVSLNNDFCTEYKDYIKYEGNGGASIRGCIKLKPVYSYINSKITVNKNTEKTAAGKQVDCKVKINGIEVEYGKELTYHMGDKLTFTSDIKGNDYVATGVQLSFRNNNTGRDEENTYSYNQGKYVEVACREKYTVLPRFSENNNRIVVQVSEEDYSHFEKTGFFDKDYLKKYGTLIDGIYNIEVVSTAQISAGASYTLAVEPADNYIPIWRETNSENYFMGTTFDYVAKTRRTANIVYLYAGNPAPSGMTTKYAVVKGKVYFENLALNNPKAAGEPILPAKEGYLSVAGQCAKTDADGNVKTKAFALPREIKIDKKAETLSKVYVRALAGAAGATEYKDFSLKLSGTEESVEDAGGTKRNAIVTQMSAITIASNRGGNARFDGIYIKNRNFATDTAYMNDESTSITATVVETETEKIKSVEFLIYDRHTNEIKHTIKAAKDDNKWTGMYTFKSDGSEDALYAEGDRIYVRMTTDKPSGKADESMSAELKELMKQTVYAPVNTGYTLVKSGLYEEPTVQALDIGSLQGLSGIPLVNNFNMNLNLGPISLTAENLYDDQQNVCGTRLKAVLNMDFDKTSKRSENYKVADDGMNYGVSALTLLSDFGKVKDSFKAAGSNFLGARNLDKAGLASMGAKKWGVYPSVGFYLDFAIAYDMDGAGTVSNSRLVLQGGGIYLGASATYSVAWYALIPVVYIPCYFGVAGKLSLALEAGGTTTVKNTKEEVKYDDFMATSHNLSETLAFDFRFSAAGQVQVYCGVGICGTLGVRGGLNISANFAWYPTLHNQYEYFDAVGVHAGIEFKMWVDLLVFTIPSPAFTIAEKDFGLLAQYEELKDKNEEELNTIISNNKKKAGAKTAQIATSAAEDSAITYLLKERDNDPEWSGKMKQVLANRVSTMATYKEKNTHTILSDGYDRPDSQMIDMGDNGTLLVFLQDDKSRTDAERTAVSYSVYKNGAYSNPVIIQTDGTADYQPNITDAGNNVIITWISSDPDKDKGSISATDYQSKYLKSQDVYVASIPKADLVAHKEVAQENIIKLTDDAYYNSDPVAVYDEKSGDYNVYYVKTAEDNGVTDVEAADLANPMNTSGKTYSVIAYRVYDASADSNNGKWLVDEYAEKEKPDNVTDEVYKVQLQKLGGQRILSSPITADDVNMQDPLISDFTAIGYNGIAVFAYTIDKDNSADTDTDRDLFMQLYDFGTRSTYKPIRITDDELADSMPQLIRRGGENDGLTYLFWKSGETLDYIDVSSLVKYGIDDNGDIIQSVLQDSMDTGDGSEGPDTPSSEEKSMTDEQANKAAYKFHIYKVDAYGEDENKFSSYSQYQVAVDADDNLYVIWVDNGDSTGQTSSQEIFAAAMIESEVAGSTEGENTMKGWSAPNKLTNFGKYCDEPALAITKDGKMLMVYNKYDITEDTDGNPSLADMELASSMFEAYGSVEAKEISLSDTTPVAGEEVGISVKFENTGLTVAKDGFTANIYEKAADGKKTLLTTYNYEAGLIATGIVDETFAYTANEKTVGSTIEVSVTENNLEGTNVNSSEPFMEKVEYEILQNNAYEGPDSKFYSEVMVTNTGNKPSGDGDELQIEFAGPYANAASYGLTNGVFAKQAVSLGAGESKTVTLELDIPAKVFGYYGRIDTEAKVVGKDGETIGDTLTDMVYMSQPAGLVLNENKDVEMKEGDTLDLKFQYETCSQLKKVTPTYVSDDESVVRIEDGKLVAASEGTAIVSAYAYPYNAATAIMVTVKGTANPGDTETPSATEEPGAMVSLTKIKIKGMFSDSKGKLTVSWNKVKGASGYEVTYATNKSFTKNKVTKKITKTSLTLKNLNGKKTYYVKVRAYNGTSKDRVFGKYSTTRYIKLSPGPSKISKPKVTALKGKIQVTIKKTKNATGYEYVLCMDKKGKKVVKTIKSKKQKVVFDKLEAKKKYYIIVRAYKETRNGGYLYGAKKILKTKTK